MPMMPEAKTKWRRETPEWRNLALFLLIAFGWSWAIWFGMINGLITSPKGLGTPLENAVETITLIPLLLLSPFGPTISAFLVTLVFEGKSGVKRLWGRFYKGKFSPMWLAVVILLQPVYFLAARLLSEALGVSQPPVAWLGVPLIVVESLFVNTIHGGLSEEFGWRGYALPRLQARFTAPLASLILGVVEGLWHLPFVFWPGNAMYGMSVIVLILWQTLATFFRTWIFNNTDGSILAAVIFHAVQNTAGILVPVTIFSIGWLPSDPYMPPAMLIIGYCILLVILLVSNPKDMMLRRRSGVGDS
jgi:membrane protease YdiL (CAAX protease family)